MKPYEELARIKTKRILDALATPMTVAELAKVIHLSHQGMSYWVKHKLQGQIHIAEWRGAGTPLYVAGPGEDAPRPKPLTRRQVWRRFYKKMREDIDRHDYRKAKERARYYTQKPRKPDAITAALFAALPGAGV